MEIQKTHPDAKVAFFTSVERTIFYTRTYFDPLHGGPVLLVPKVGGDPVGVFLPGEEVP